MQASNIASANSKPSILIVEDDVAKRERLYDVLTRHGWAVTAAQSMACALDILKHEYPSVILADSRLADASGWELAAQIRRFDTHLPIILLGNGRPAGDGSGIGMVQACLPTDVADDALLREIDRWLARPHRPPRPRWPGTLLVVDDEPKVRSVLQEFLEAHGFQVAVAASGEETLEQVKRGRPSVVLLDIKMPGMDGLLTLKKIKAVHADSIVVMMTGLQEEQTMVQAFALGADDYITKPFNLDYLETVLLGKILIGPAP